MVQIKVTRGGCGVKYTDAHGNARHALKTPESGPFECDDTQASRLVSMGVAEYVNTDAKSAKHTQEPVESAQKPKKDTNRYTAEELEKWGYNNLKALAADLDAVPTSGKKRGDYIAAIVAAQADADAVDDTDDELPELTAAAPE